MPCSGLSTARITAGYFADIHTVIVVGRIKPVDFAAEDVAFFDVVEIQFPAA